MNRLIDGLRTDLDFLRGHTLQPGWFKLLKVLILLGVLAAGWLLFGWRRALVFLALFALLSLAVHCLYRVKTRAWTTSWLDFVVEQRDGRREYRRIGAWYYAAVLFDAGLAFLLSGWLVPAAGG